jgi:hypothetical protein
MADGKARQDIDAGKQERGAHFWRANNARGTKAAAAETDLHAVRDRIQLTIS